MGYRTKRESGFSLLEMIIAMALGMIVLGAAVQLYTISIHIPLNYTLDEVQAGFKCEGRNFFIV